MNPYIRVKELMKMQDFSLKSSSTGPSLSLKYGFYKLTAIIACIK
jgi:hypothetical protein